MGGIVAGALLVTLGLSEVVGRLVTRVEDASCGADVAVTWCGFKVVFDDGVEVINKVDASLVNTDEVLVDKGALEYIAFCKFKDRFKAINFLILFYRGLTSGSKWQTC